MNRRVGDYLHLIKHVVRVRAELHGGKTRRERCVRGGGCVHTHIPRYNLALGVYHTSPNPGILHAGGTPALTRSRGRTARVRSLRERAQAGRYFQPEFMYLLNNPVVGGELIIAAPIQPLISPGPRSPCTPPRVSPRRAQVKVSQPPCCS